jgi:hypothetical protein
MSEKKSLEDRQKELQSQLVTSEGREELQKLAQRYAELSGRVHPIGKSAITYILVHERERGIIEAKQASRAP